MARDFAQLRTSMWKVGSDYRDLAMAEQWLYEAIVSQHDLTTAGVLIWRPSRWSRLCTDITPDEVERVARSLVEKRYLLIDEDTDEVLVRTFIRHDTGNGNWKIRKGAQSAIGRIESDRLRAFAQAEFDALPPLRKKDDPPPPEDPEGQSDGDGTMDRTPIDPPIEGEPDHGPHQLSPITDQLSPSTSHLSPDNYQLPTSSSSEPRLKLAGGTAVDDDQATFDKALDLVIRAKAVKHPPNDYNAWKQIVVPQTISESGDAIRASIARGASPFDIACALVGKVPTRTASRQAS